VDSRAVKGRMRREGQIARTANLVKGICRFRAGQFLVRKIQTSSATGPLYRTMMGYQRPFASLQEAKAAVSKYGSGGHENSQNVKNHLGMYKTARSSDYAALFYIRPILPGIRKVF